MDIDNQLDLVIVETGAELDGFGCRPYTQLYINFLESPLPPGCRHAVEELEIIYNCKTVYDGINGITRLLFQSQEDRLEFILTYG